MILSMLISAFFRLQLFAIRVQSYTIKLTYMYKILFFILLPLILFTYCHIEGYVLCHFEAFLPLGSATFILRIGFMDGVLYEMLFYINLEVLRFFSECVNGVQRRGVEGQNVVFL